VPSKIHHIFICLLLLVPATFPVEAQSFYPLGIGNRWNYQRWEQGKSDTSFTCVLRDSLFPDGFRYYVLSKDDLFGGRYVRTDSQFVYYFDEREGSDVALLDTKGKPGDTTFVHWQWGSIVWVILSKVDTQDVFGMPTRVLHYSLEGLVWSYVNLAENFGPLISEDWGDACPLGPCADHWLIGARIDTSIFGYVTSVSEPQLQPNRAFLAQNFPNPFNPSTTLSYELPVRSNVTLKIFNLLGQEVAILVFGEKEAGRYSIEWNASNVPSGVYFCRLEALPTNRGNSATFVAAKRMMLVK
jgi:hypothetical protein